MFWMTTPANPEKGWSMEGMGKASRMSPGPRGEVSACSSEPDE